MATIVASGLLDRPLRPADQVLPLPLDPEVRRIVGDIGQNRNEWRVGYRIAHAIPDRAIQIGYQRDHQVWPALPPQFLEHPDLRGMQQADEPLGTVTLGLSLQLHQTLLQHVQSFRSVCFSVQR